MLTLLVPTGAAMAGARCPRCERDVAPEDLEDATLDELRLIDPHLDSYAHRAVKGEIAVCAACLRQPPFCSDLLLDTVPVASYK